MSEISTLPVTFTIHEINNAQKIRLLQCLLGSCLVLVPSRQFCKFQSNSILSRNQTILSLIACMNHKN
jgi:hypothetical protein